MDNKRIMVAGIGNMLIQDDGFGTEVIRKLRSKTLPSQVAVEDFGISGVRMAHRLIEGFDLLIVADIAKRGGKPGTLYVIEIDPAEELPASRDLQIGLTSGHTMGSDEVFSLIKSFNSWPKKVLLVCCEPLLYEEYAIGLSEPVQNAVDRAIDIIQSLIEKELN